MLKAKMHKQLNVTNSQRKLIVDFSGNSKAFASELLNLIYQNYMHSDICTRLKYVAAPYCVIHKITFIVTEEFGFQEHFHT